MKPRKKPEPIDVAQLAREQPGLVLVLPEEIPAIPTAQLALLRFPLLCDRNLHRLREQVEAELAARREGAELRDAYGAAREEHGGVR